jgi:hypothetical protein
MDLSKKHLIERLSFLPNMFPGEHILGAFARILYLNSSSDDKLFQKDLTGNNSSLTVTAAYHKSYDVLLALYSDQKSREEILNQHTLMGFYRHGMKYQHRQQLLTMPDKKERESIYLPGATMLQSATSWRWCNSCVQQEEKIYGIASWQVRHQLPTSMTCDIHCSETLHSKCSNCGFMVHDLRGLPMPPKGSCPTCDFTIHSMSQDLSPDAKWIQHTGIELHKSDSTFLKPRHEYAMKYAAGLVTARKWKINSNNIWAIYDYHQKEFTNWLLENRLDQLFIARIDLQRCKALDIEKVIELPRKVPAVAHLLWLRYLGVHSLRDVKINGFVHPNVTV